MTNKDTTKVITGVARLSYAHLFKPVSFQGEEPKYSASLIISKEDKKTVEAIKAAIAAAERAGKEKNGSSWKAKRVALRDGDVDAPPKGGEIYNNSYFINASSEDAPGVLDVNKQRTADPNAVYSGCYVIASIRFYPYSFAGNNGIGAGLQNVLKIKDGARLGGRVEAEDDFAEVDLSEYAPNENELAGDSEVISDEEAKQIFDDLPF
jgi:hypothetical protein